MSEKNTKSAAVIGGTGFVGKSIVRGLERRGWNVRVINAPRLHFSEMTSESALPHDAFISETRSLSQQLQGCEAVINAAGDPNASSSDLNSLMGPNAALPVVIKRAAEIAQVERFVHVSSSVVQGDCAILDSSYTFRSFSPYSHSKICAEKWLLEEPKSITDLTIYRPPSVHAAGRGVTEKIRSLASSPISSVAGFGTGPTPQALLENVGDAVAFLVTSPDAAPSIVHHPWEGLTSAELLRLLGNKEPRHIPRWVARSLIAITKIAEGPLPFLAPNRRRLELLWFGQGVATSWFDLVGWVPPLNRKKWAELGKSNSPR